MIVLTIALVLLLASAPLARSWMANARLGQAESQLLQAYAKVRAVALRNPLAATGTTAAASLRLVAPRQLQVYQGSSGTLAWSATLPEGVDGWLAADAAAASAGCSNTLPLDNAGLPLAACVFYHLSADGGDHRASRLR